MTSVTRLRGRRITPALLRSWPLPMPDGDEDKAERGRLLAVAGSRDVPGAALLVADAALRAGVGKLCIASDPRIASELGFAVPEARVVEADRDALVAESDRFDALLVGPGIAAPSRTLCKCMRDLGDRISPVVVDAGALDVFAGRRSEGNVIFTPHMGEMAHLLDRDKSYVVSHAAQIAVDFAAERGVVLALKGPCTFIADPDGGLWIYDKSNVGLAISGSGDVLAGVIAALVARGASCAQAAVWGVALHAEAGRRLVRQHGPLGGLARELPGHIPAALRAFAPR